MKTDWEDLLTRVVTQNSDGKSRGEVVNGVIEAVTRDSTDRAQVLSALSRLSTVSQALGSQRAMLPASGGGTQGVIASLVPAVVRSEGAAGSGLASSIGSTLLSGFTLAPLISGLLDLFGGGKADAPQALPRFALPSAISTQEGFSRSTGSVPVETSYGQNGLSRAAVQPTQAQPQITIQVQAMDSRSFMDHSEAIAGAVREAMLHSHSLNDVVMEL